MKNYASLILNALLDKFERSNLAFLSREELAGSPASKISISVLKDKLFADYWVQDCYLYRPDIDCAVKELCAKGFCFARWDESRDLPERVGLCLDKVDQAFSYAGRTRQQDKDSGESEMLRKKRQGIHCNTVGRFLDELEQLVRNHKSHSEWYSSGSDLDLLLKMIDAVENQEEEILLRNFSKRNFSDSKVFERNQTRILKVFNRFGETGNTYNDFDSLCKEHNIVRNEGFVLIKGGVRLGIAGQAFDLSEYPYVFPIPNKAFKDLSIIDVSVSKLITIENLTTFNYYNDPDAIVVYLGGFAGRHEIGILKKIHERTSNLQFFHMGDIDWGGIRIFMDLRKKTLIPFKPLNMSIKELEEYRDECIPLSERDRDGLAKLLDDEEAAEFRDVISFMLGNGYKLEQESLLFC